jgi:hypothetical protein
METVFSVGSAPRLYSEDPRPAESIIESLEMAARIDRAVVKRRLSVWFEDFMCAVVAVRLINPLPEYD